MRTFDLVAPTTLRDVLELLAENDEETRLIAGGTGLLNLVKHRLAHPERLVSLHKLEGLDQVDVEDDAITIGALCRLADIERHRDVADRLPVLASALHEIASPRIRDMATIGGAVAHGDPAQDLPVALMALDAVVIAESAKGEVEVPIGDLYRDYYETTLLPDQLVTRIRIPLPSPTSRFAYKKYLPGSQEDYACVSVCVRLELDGRQCLSARVVLGAAGPTVYRASNAEAVLEGVEINEEFAQTAAEAARESTDPIEDTRGSTAYKRRMAMVWTRRMILAASA